ncbi:MAG: SDR family NAD(P)-dependent oxidoreductase [Desulfosarcinaceae bacterium]|nr:SDR family NAD(P)-dependent oxidoreductase [Desulfosarcinaceae bacterium]
MERHWQETRHIEIAQPVATVFDYLNHWEYVEEWDPGVVSARKLDSGPPAAGSRYRLRVRLGWRRIPMTYTITASDPPHALTLAGRGETFQVEDRIRLDAIASGTRLTYDANVRFDRDPGFLAHHAGKRLFAGYAAKAVDRLQRMLTGSSRPPQLTAWTRMADRTILPGLIGFTRLGFLAARHRRPVASQLYRGRTMVLTGGTSGIGKAAAISLYRLGVQLVVVGRNAKKLSNLVEEMGKSGGGEIHTEVADLSRMGEVRELADRLTRRYRKIDVLINNAGAMFNRFQLNAEGIEMTMATDLLSPYLLSRLLEPSLTAAGAARIINVASGGMYTQAMRADMLVPNAVGHDGPTAYARAKRGLVILTQHLAKALASEGIGVHAMHPGWVDTPGLADALPKFYHQVSAWLRSPSQGADTIVWLAAAPDAQRASGRFWLDRKLRATHVFGKTRTTMAAQRELIHALDTMLGLPPLPS